MSLPCGLVCPVPCLVLFSHVFFCPLFSVLWSQPSVLCPLSCALLVCSVLCPVPILWSCLLSCTLSCLVPFVVLCPALRACPVPWYVLVFNPFVLLSCLFCAALRCPLSCFSDPLGLSRFVFYVRAQLKIGLTRNPIYATFLRFMLLISNWGEKYMLVLMSDLRGQRIVFCAHARAIMCELW